MHFVEIEHYFTYIETQQGVMTVSTDWEMKLAYWKDEYHGAATTSKNHSKVNWRNLKTADLEEAKKVLYKLCERQS
ncbi:hypothetical protein ATL39_1950 [Sinobaca qinghaiensis]|uniref:Uncharacterized protein n=1 Tax=Sinobaca qinghaiensis TaxID=342944 RepID=A0A419V547_9BACL|nr:hypothetical protein [Sinobaca qinghaiensis]RKD73648.1 hypothetical protein ATL39_1950 [Sinobaca qinghaiensis]